MSSLCKAAPSKGVDPCTFGFQERRSGVLNNATAQKSPSSGVQRPRISLSSQTATSPCILLHHVGHSRNEVFCTACDLPILCPLTVRISSHFRQVLGQPSFELWSEPDLLLPCGQTRHTPFCRGPGAGRGWAESVSASHCPGQLLPQWEPTDLHLQVSVVPAQQEAGAAGT